jgi:hypothetical protein
MNALQPPTGNACALTPARFGHKGHSTAYSPPFIFKSYTKDLSFTILILYYRLVLKILTTFKLRSSCMLLDLPRERNLLVCKRNILKATYHRSFQKKTISSSSRTQQLAHPRQCSPFAQTDLWSLTRWGKQTTECRTPKRAGFRSSFRTNVGRKGTFQRCRDVTTSAFSNGSK